MVPSSDYRPVSADAKWGIIGDGQLARMLAQEAYSLGIRPLLLTQDRQSPAGQICPQVVLGAISSTTDLHALLSQVDHAIIESEFLDCDAIEATGLSHKVIPSISALRVLQNKLQQKRLFASLGLPSSRLYEPTVIGRDDFVFGGSKVLKFATLGYDGKGVCLLQESIESSVREANQLKAREFIENARERRIEVYAEDRVDFRHEVALIACRSLPGEMIHYPLVMTEQENGICKKVLGPATSLGLSSDLEHQAAEIAKKIATHLSLVGTFGIEFFVAKDGKLYINEVAPRVHNSGHYTQNACTTSQFMNHWRAVLGLPLGSTVTAERFGMINLLGPKAIYSQESMSRPKCGRYSQSHWYGKMGSSPGRKLGHINVTCHSEKDFEAAWAEAKIIEEQWIAGTKAFAHPPMEIRL